MFVDSPETTYEYPTIKRSGLFYRQFFWMAKDGNDCDDTSETKIDNLQQQEVSFFNHNEKNFRIFVSKHQLTLPSKIPGYMVENMYQKVVIGGRYFPVPNDSELILMYFYPDSWFVTYENCMV